MVKILQCALLITMMFSNQLLANNFMKDLKKSIFNDLLHETNYKIMKHLYHQICPKKAVQLAYEDIEKYLQQTAHILEKDTQIVATALVSYAKGGTLDQKDPKFEPCAKFMHNAKTHFPSLLCMLKKQLIPPYSAIGIPWIFCCCKRTKPQMISIKSMQEKITECVRLINNNLAEFVREFSILFQLQDKIVAAREINLECGELLYNDIYSILRKNSGPNDTLQQTKRLLNEKLKINVRNDLASRLLSHLPRIIADQTYLELCLIFKQIPTTGHRKIKHVCSFRRRVASVYSFPQTKQTTTSRCRRSARLKQQTLLPK